MKNKIEQLQISRGILEKIIQIARQSGWDACGTYTPDEGFWMPEGPQNIRIEELLNKFVNQPNDKIAIHFEKDFLTHHLEMASGAGIGCILSYSKDTGVHSNFEGEVAAPGLSYVKSLLGCKADGSDELLVAGNFPRGKVVRNFTDPESGLQIVVRRSNLLFAAYVGILTDKNSFDVNNDDSDFKSCRDHINFWEWGADESSWAKNHFWLGWSYQDRAGDIEMTLGGVIRDATVTATKIKDVLLTNERFSMVFKESVEGKSTDAPKG